MFRRAAVSEMPVDSADEVIKAALVSQFSNFFQQIFPKGAADAAIAHLDQFSSLRLSGDFVFDDRGIDVDFTHIVDDDSDPPTLAVVENMTEHCSLSGAEKAG
ncbi:MAG: hypothetical protein CM15mP84_10620 [Cellvibrionales bacterium]|nr:MAG: hypothetical protein CM15mP84_10620 [Cellvibrionales bacterium]